MLYKMPLKPVMLLLLAAIILTACGTIKTDSSKPTIQAISCLAVWTEQPFYWPEKCDTDPTVGECPILERVARIAQANNAALKSLKETRDGLK